MNILRIRDLTGTGARRKLAKSTSSISSQSLLSNPSDSGATSSDPTTPNSTAVGVSTSSNSSSHIIYWMCREMRLEYNWGLLHSLQLREKHKCSILVCFALGRNYENNSSRHHHFELESLKSTYEQLRKLNIPMEVVEEKNVASYLLKTCKEKNCHTLVVDFHPVRDFSNVILDVSKHQPELRIHQVDSHNIVPAWIVSQKVEYAARTIRPKINNLLEDFMKERFPSDIAPIPVQDLSQACMELLKNPPDWEHFSSTINDDGVLNVDKFFPPGREEALKRLERFLSQSGIALQDTKRNDPNCAQVGSRLSAYINFGLIAAQEIVAKTREFAKTPLGQKCHAGIATFLEELIIRRELADNFVFYNKDYDSVIGAATWAKETLILHEGDKREHLYTLDELENGQTFDPLWNAAQKQARVEGHMHGFLRMYWAKKILEWTPSPIIALQTCLLLNDRYNLDGNNCPNGFVGAMWSICGVHDQGWSERPVFGKIRYMNFQGCQRKFDVKAFISKYENIDVPRYKPKNNDHKRLLNTVSTLGVKDDVTTCMMPESKKFKTM